YLLSTLTTALLPITLVTGIFGMNLTDLPFANSRHGFAIVVVLMSLGVAVAMHLLRRRRLE
ncbi:MAG TPA: CorA family divalent cation transporter, partial [Polyangiaceae bacterium]|nr:CorA family divalent cation transporter [Polyangiaceae bacterium]